MRALVSWAWLGNVREYNFIERSVILSRGSALRAHLPELRADAVEPMGRRSPKSNVNISFAFSGRRVA
ncbi:MAG: hypothetical protein ABI822_27080 [Bryobacteraceae bacterium]